MGEGLGEGLRASTEPCGRAHGSQSCQVRIMHEKIKALASTIMNATKLTIAAVTSVNTQHSPMAALDSEHDDFLRHYSNIIVLVNCEWM